MSLHLSLAQFGSKQGRRLSICRIPSVVAGVCSLGYLTQPDPRCEPDAQVGASVKERLKPANQWTVQTAVEGDLLTRQLTSVAKFTCPGAPSSASLLSVKTAIQAAMTHCSLMPMIISRNVPTAARHMARLGLPESAPAIVPAKRGRPKKGSCPSSDLPLVAVYYGEQLMAHSLRATKPSDTFRLSAQPFPRFMRGLQSAAKQQATAAGLSADDLSLTLSRVPETAAASLPQGQWGLKFGVAELHDYEAAIGAQVC